MASPGFPDPSLTPASSYPASYQAAPGPNPIAGPIKVIGIIHIVLGVFTLIVALGFLFLAIQGTRTRPTRPGTAEPVPTSSQLLPPVKTLEVRA